ncbi:hypothetical protein TNCV_2433471 [Trichonephila clavipes]|nr:hypothetical protein TNCV_2433471 [Trichonephila clavipes]
MHRLNTYVYYVRKSSVLRLDYNLNCLDSDWRRALIWREHGSQFRSSNTVEKNHYGRGGLMVLADIIADGYTDLHVFDRGTLGRYWTFNFSSNDFGARVGVIAAGVDKDSDKQYETPM